MSDDWIEDGIRDNAGHLALAGALMAHSQRRQQLQSLEASRLHQAQIARTEGERLEVEKQRLKLERLKQQADKEEKEAVRQLRVLMAEVGGDFEFLSSRGDFKGSPKGIRRDYAMAVLLSKLALVRSRSDSLSDLNDLKELSRLETLAEDLISRHFDGSDPEQATRNKWLELDTWMQSVERFETEVNLACLVVQDCATAVQLPSQADLVMMQTNLESFATRLAANLSEHIRCLPVNALEDGVILAELTKYAELVGLTSEKPSHRHKVFANRWRQANDILSQTVNSSLAKLKEWQDKHAEHDQIIQTLAIQLQQGELSVAVTTSKKLGNTRFAELNYDPLRQLISLQGACGCLALAKRDSALKIVLDLRQQYSNATDKSELAKLMDRHQERALKEKRDSFFRGIFTLGLTAVFDKLEDQAFRKMETKQRELIGWLNAGAIGDEVNVNLGAEIRQMFCFIPSGTFNMEKGRSNKGQVEVTISLPFWLAKTEVTQAQWVSVIGRNPSHFKGAQLPVENVSWKDAQLFIARLNLNKRLLKGWRFALPTEAQWEYACRAGETGPYSVRALDDVAWHNGNSELKTHEVGQKKPNAWGLHDMHGNVYEWCADHVSRGGAWMNGASAFYSVIRSRQSPSDRFKSLGFRLALVPSK